MPLPCSTEDANPYEARAPLSQARQQLHDWGAPGVLKGLGSMGSTLLREQAAAFGEKLKGSPATAEPLTAQAQVQTARQTRLRYDGVRKRAMQMMGGWDEASEDEESSHEAGGPGRGMGRGRGRGGRG